MIFWIIFSILIALFFAFAIYFIYSSIKEIKLIRSGLIDDELKSEKEKNNTNKNENYVSKVLSTVFLSFLALIFVLSLLNRYSTNFKTPIQLTVVASGSMSWKNEDNLYLYKYDNQINTFDLIALEHINSFEEIKQYDIISYKDNKRGINVIHRVREIKDNYLLMRGDANDKDDDIIVTFDMINGRYNGFKIPYIGVFILYLQSEYGILTISIFIGSYIIYVSTEYFLNKEKNKRIKNNI